MNTPMTDVLELFIDKMSENEDLVKDVLELEPEALLLELKPKIRSALSKCMQLKIKADFNTFEFVKPDGTEMNDTEQEIIALWLVYEWLLPQVNKDTALQNYLTTKEYNSLSTTGLATTRRTLLNKCKADASNLETKYFHVQRANKRIEKFEGELP